MVVDACRSIPDIHQPGGLVTIRCFAGSSLQVAGPFYDPQQSQQLEVDFRADLPRMFGWALMGT